MPWHWEPKKDVVTNERCGEPETGIDPQISEWRNPYGQYPYIMR